MAAGGIRDHLAGGFARYSTDPHWLVPHFEKMLYDQALVSAIYLDAFQYTGEPRYAEVAREILDYCLADLQAPEGGFYSARDADSDGEEGKFYVWTKAEIVAVLGEPESTLVCAYYGVTDEGNWDDPHAPGEPKNVLYTPRALDEVAQARDLAVGALRTRLSAARQALKVARAQRTPPGLDTKILCEWNGMLIASLARAGAVLDEPRYVAAAERAADFLLTRQLEDGRLKRAWCDGRALEMAFLTDYACLIDGLIELYQATFDRRWLEQARRLNNAALEHFWDEAAGGFFFTADDHPLVLTRSKDVSDGATPSGNSVMLGNLLRLAAMFADGGLRSRAERMIAVFGESSIGRGGANERFLCGVDEALSGAKEIVVVGDPDTAATQALLRAARAGFSPSHVLLLKRGAAGDDIATPLFEGRSLVDGRPTAYVCERSVCQRPVTAPTELRDQLERKGDGQ